MIRKGAALNVLFDLDGTLTDPGHGISACIAHALATLGRPVPEKADLERFIGPPLRDAFRDLLPDQDAAGIDGAVTAYRDRFTKVGMFENALYAGIPEASTS